MKSLKAYFPSSVNFTARSLPLGSFLAGPNHFDIKSTTGTLRLESIWVSLSFKRAMSSTLTHFILPVSLSRASVYSLTLARFLASAMAISICRASPLVNCFCAISFLIGSEKLTFLPLTATFSKNSSSNLRAVGFKCRSRQTKPGSAELDTNRDLDRPLALR